MQSGLLILKASLEPIIRKHPQKVGFKHYFHNFQNCLPKDRMKKWRINSLPRYTNIFSYIYIIILKDNYLTEFFLWLIFSVLTAGFSVLADAFSILGFSFVTVFVVGNCFSVVTAVVGDVVGFLGLLAFAAAA